MIFVDPLGHKNMSLAWFASPWFLGLCCPQTEESMVSDALTGIVVHEKNDPPALQQ